MIIIFCVVETHCRASLQRKSFEMKNPEICLQISGFFENAFTIKTDDIHFLRGMDDSKVPDWLLTRCLLLPK